MTWAISPMMVGVAGSRKGKQSVGQSGFEHRPAALPHRRLMSESETAKLTLPWRPKYFTPAQMASKQFQVTGFEDAAKAGERWEGHVFRFLHFPKTAFFY
jgi:hypothetical protein